MVQEPWPALASRRPAPVPKGWMLALPDRWVVLQQPEEAGRRCTSWVEEPKGWRTLGDLPCYERPLVARSERGLWWAEGIPGPQLPPVLLQQGGSRRLIDWGDTSRGGWLRLESATDGGLWLSGWMQRPQAGTLVGMSIRLDPQGQLVGRYEADALALTGRSARETRLHRSMAAPGGVAVHGRHNTPDGGARDRIFAAWFAREGTGWSTTLPETDPQWTGPLAGLSGTDGQRLLLYAGAGDATMLRAVRLSAAGKILGQALVEDATAPAPWTLLRARGEPTDLWLLSTRQTAEGTELVHSHLVGWPPELRSQRRARSPAGLITASVAISAEGEARIGGRLEGRPWGARLP